MGFFNIISGKSTDISSWEYAEDLFFVYFNSTDVLLIAPHFNSMIATKLFLSGLDRNWVTERFLLIYEMFTTCILH